MQRLKQRTRRTLIHHNFMIIALSRSLLILKRLIVNKINTLAVIIK